MRADQKTVVSFKQLTYFALCSQFRFHEDYTEECLWPLFAVGTRVSLVGTVPVLQLIQFSILNKL